MAAFISTMFHTPLLSELLPPQEPAWCVEMPVNDEKLTKLAMEVAKLRGEVWELSVRLHALEARMVTISEMLEAAGEHET